MYLCCHCIHKQCFCHILTLTHWLWLWFLYVPHTFYSLAVCHLCIKKILNVLFFSHIDFHSFLNVLLLLLFRYNVWFKNFEITAKCNQTYVNNDRKVKLWRSKKKLEEKNANRMYQNFNYKKILPKDVFIFTSLRCVSTSTTGHLVREIRRVWGVQIEVHFKLTAGLIKQICMLDGSFLSLFL